MRLKALIVAMLMAWPQLLTAAPALAQGSARDGCMNQWLFNGVWRAKVTSVQPNVESGRQTGWEVTQVWRNGTAQQLAPSDSMMNAEQLVLSGQTLPAEEHRQQGLTYNTFAPAGEFTYTQVFYGPNMSVDPSDKPKALDVTFDNAKLAAINKPHFSSKQYNFHYNLNCVASGSAAQAQGGSTQLAANEGCMNQWMSNGVWKMRVLSVSPMPPGTDAKSQFGWRVRQEWTNITRSNLVASFVPEAGRHAVQANVADEFLVTKSGNNASSANTPGGFAIGAGDKLYAPGVSYTFDQTMEWSPFDAADTPTRLLVTFNSARQNAVPGIPHYRKPANFRINLACGGTVTTAGGE